MSNIHCTVWTRDSSRDLTWRQWIDFDTHLLHRENDLPAVECVNGDRFWYLNGVHHRENGPAFIRYNGDSHWYLNGSCHREDGPAIELADGDKYYHLHGKRYREDEYYNEIQSEKDQCCRFQGHPLYCNHGE